MLSTARTDEGRPDWRQRRSYQGALRIGGFGAPQEESFENRKKAGHLFLCGNVNGLPQGRPDPARINGTVQRALVPRKTFAFDPVRRGNVSVQLIEDAPRRLGAIEASHGQKGRRRDAGNQPVSREDALLYAPELRFGPSRGKKRDENAHRPRERVPGPWFPALRRCRRQGSPRPLDDGFHDGQPEPGPASV